MIPQFTTYRIDGFPVMKDARFKVEAAEKRRGARPRVEQSSEIYPYFGREMILVGPIGK